MALHPLNGRSDTSLRRVRRRVELGALVSDKRDRLVPEQSPVVKEGAGRGGQASKGVWGMSGRQEAVGRGRLRKAGGSRQTGTDPRIPEPTPGTETSQYREEEKATATPSVAASESGPAQTEGLHSSGL